MTLGIAEHYTEVLGEVREAIEAARRSSLDLSREYLDEESEGYRLQQEIRLTTRSLRLWGYSFGFAADAANADSLPVELLVSDGLSALQEAVELFGEHPFHHVLEGRIADIAKNAAEKGVPVPQRFAQYKYMEIQPYQRPSLNYNTPRDIDRDSNPEWIPPGWSPN